MVIKGILDMEIEGRPYKLYPGDSAYIRKGERHRIFNTGEDSCVSIWVYHRNSSELFHLKGENKIVK